MKGHRFGGKKDVFYTEKLAWRARSTILLQRNPSFGEMLDQVQFCCKV